jgi:hypothetical protein
VVYFARFQNRLIKIGYSYHPEERVKQFTWSRPRLGTAELLGKLPGKYEDEHLALSIWQSLAVPEFVVPKRLCEVFYPHPALLSWIESAVRTGKVQREYHV